MVHAWSIGPKASMFPMQQNVDRRRDTIQNDFLLLENSVNFKNIVGGTITITLILEKLILVTDDSIL